MAKRIEVSLDASASVEASATPGRKTYQDFGIPESAVWSHFEFSCRVEWQGKNYVVDPDGGTTEMGD